MTTQNPGFNFNLSSIGMLFLCAFLIGDGLLKLLGVFTPGHAISVGDAIALCEFIAGILLLFRR